MKKRVGLKEAKRIFHKRSIHSQALDRRKTSKNLVYPYSKNSYKWKRDPSKYDMVGVDTKSTIQKKIIGNEVYIPWGKTRSKEEAVEEIRNLLGIGTNRWLIPESMSMKKLQKKSNLDVKIRKNDDEFNLFFRPKKNQFVMFHPVMMQKRRKY